MEMMKGMIKSAYLARPEDKREPIEDIYQKIEETRPEIQEGFRKQMILTSFYIYRNISNEDF